MVGAGIPRRGRYFGERLHDADAEFDFGHRGQSCSFHTLRRNLSGIYPTLAATPVSRSADHDIETSRNAIPIVTRFGVAAGRDWMAAVYGASDLARNLASACRRRFFGGRRQYGAVITPSHLRCGPIRFTRKAKCDCGADNDRQRVAFHSGPPRTHFAAETAGTSLRFLCLAQIRVANLQR